MARKKSKKQLEKEKLEELFKNEEINEEKQEEVKDIEIYGIVAGDEDEDK